MGRRYLEESLERNDRGAGGEVAGQTAEDVNCEAPVEAPVENQHLGKGRAHIT